MPEGTVLPAFVAAPAKLAASAAPERADAAAPVVAEGDAGAESFGQVLQSRMSAREGGQDASPPEQRASTSAEEPVADAAAPTVAGEAMALQAGVLALLQQQPGAPLAREGMGVTRELGDGGEGARGDRGRNPLLRLTAQSDAVVGEDRVVPDTAGKTSG